MNYSDIIVQLYNMIYIYNHYTVLHIIIHILIKGPRSRVTLQMVSKGVLLESLSSFGAWCPSLRVRPFWAVVLPRRHRTSSSLAQWMLHALWMSRFDVVWYSTMFVSVALLKHLDVALSQKPLSWRWGREQRWNGTAAYAMLLWRLRRSKEQIDKAKEVSVNTRVSACGAVLT